MLSFQHPPLKGLLIQSSMKAPARNLSEAQTLFVAVRMQGYGRKRRRKGRLVFDETYDDIFAPDRLSRLIARNFLGALINNVISPLKRVFTGDISPPPFVTGWNWLGFGMGMGQYYILSRCKFGMLAKSSQA